MPPDTLSITPDTARLLSRQLPSVDSLSGLPEYFPQKMQEGPVYLFPEWLMFLMVLGIIAFFYWLCRPFNSYTSGFLKRGLSARANSWLYLNRVKVDQWLEQHHPYYSSLSGKRKEQFLYRLAVFMLTKTFHFRGIEESAEKKWMISSAAVQISFGLRNFLFDYFKIINITGSEYRLQNHPGVFMGHVSNKSISVSWDNFLRGYQDYSDAENVGLHEMAHALSFDVFLGQSDHFDYQLKNKLIHFSEKSLPYLRAMRRGRPQILDEYATENFDEFWAVCIETFFEKPLAFSREMPDLYLIICDLLNQDPLRTDKIINAKQAGLADSD